MSHDSTVMSPETRGQRAASTADDDEGADEPVTARQGKRRKPRVVSHLEPERLQRKRQVDRKAQQALRDRAKSRIQTLEAEISTLSQATEQRERDHVTEVTALREENVQLRRKLDRIAELIWTGSDHALNPSCNDEANPYCTPDEHSMGVAPARDIAQWPLVAGNDISTVKDRTGDCSTSVGVTDSRHLSEFEADTPLESRGGNLDSEELNNAPEPEQSFYPDVCTSAKSTVTADFRRGPAAIVCAHLSSTCVLDSILINFYTEQKKLLSKGASLLSVLGPSRPFVASIVHPGSQANQHPICRIIEDVMSTFGHIQVPEKLGMVFKMHATLRWLINPDSENYEYMPRWLRPTATQITTPHAAWIDNIPWPAVRDMLIENPVLYRFEVFSEVYSHTVSVNWPYDIDDALTMDESTGHLVIAPIFEKHASRLSNWTASKEFEEHFPELARMTKRESSQR